MMTELRFCAIVPTHNHWRALPGVVKALQSNRLPIFIIDDGSDDEAARAIIALHDPDSGVHVIRFADNRGKGAAVIDGFRAAVRAGYTHALQVDADGQHDLDRICDLITAAHTAPHALISGRPVYDGSVPVGRKFGRWITHIWVFIETLSFRISDSMCGFRVYPLTECIRLLNEEDVGQRMDFDTDIMVRLFWRGVPPVMIGVRVIYPEGNPSNFRMWHDNVRISWMHTRLVATMLMRLGPILRNRPPKTDTFVHWARMNERGISLAISASATVARLFGRTFCGAFLAPAVLYFWATGSQQRKASADYLGRVLRRPVTARDTLHHFFSFAMKAVDSFRAWSGALKPDVIEVVDREALLAAVRDPRGALVLVSHHGNAEIARALMGSLLSERITILVHTHHAAHFNRAITKHAQLPQGRVLQVTGIGPDTAILLRERIEAGEWIVIAADRTPVSDDPRTVETDFLGAPARFSQGPWLLGFLLECPVYTLFCPRTGKDVWSFCFEKVTDAIQLPRRDRITALTTYAAVYAQRLEEECRRAPFQWYNFFDFWSREASR